MLARQACASGLTVVSGGALGIDSHAHTGALEAGGKTVLVAAGGRGRVYPSPHEKLFREAAAAGAVIWEHPPGTRLTQRGFLHRNRLIAALSGVTVLVEAAERSGALNTGGQQRTSGVWSSGCQGVSTAQHRRGFIGRSPMAGPRFCSEPMICRSSWPAPRSGV